MSDSLTQIGIYLTRATLPVIIIIGILGNSFNIAVLTRPALYRHSCSHYFLALAGNNLIYSGIISITRLLSGGYQINLSNYSITSCKIVTYINTINAFLSPYLIVLASIDRYCASSANAQIRKFSSIRVVQWAIITIIGVFSVFFINILVLSDLQRERGSNCAVQANSVYSQIYIITQVMLFAVIPPSLMTFFGLLAIRNSRRSRLIQVAASRYNRTEYQLARMLFFQVGIHILLTLPTSVTYLMSILPNTIRTTSIFSFISTVFQLLFNCSYVMPFFLYLLAGRIYRKQLIRLLSTKCRIHIWNQVDPITNQNTIQLVKSSVHL